MFALVYEALACVVEDKRSVDDTAALIARHLKGNSNSSVLSTGVPPSPTVGTKEALAAMNQIWCNETGPGVTFEIYSDSTEKGEEPKAPFQIFSDDCHKYRLCGIHYQIFGIFYTKKGQLLHKNNIANISSF